MLQNSTTPNYYCDTETKGRLFFNELPKNTYFLGGYQDESQKGFAMYLTFDNGTCLIPISDMNGKQVVMIERAGQEIK